MTQEEKEKEVRDLELRKVKALEKIGNSLDALTIWFEEIDKEEWNQRALEAEAEQEWDQEDLEARYEI